VCCIAAAAAAVAVVIVVNVDTSKHCYVLRYQMNKNFPVFRVGLFKCV